MVNQWHCILYSSVMFLPYFYSMLQGLVDFDGYYLESDPCLVCNNPEVPYAVSTMYYIEIQTKTFTWHTCILMMEWCMISFFFFYKEPEAVLNQSRLQIHHHHSDSEAGG